MVPWYTVSCASGAAGACRWGQEPRALCDSSERDAAGRVCPYLQLPGQSQGERIREMGHNVMQSREMNMLEPCTHDVVMQFLFLLIPKYLFLGSLFNLI